MMRRARALVSIGPFVAFERLIRQRGSSLMEVLIALLVFVIVAATAFKIIGFSRNLSTLHSRKQKIQDNLGQVWVDIFSGQGFVQRIFTAREREQMRRAFLEEGETKGLIFDLSRLKPWLSPKKRQTLKLKLASLPPTEGPFVLQRRVIAQDPWLVHLAILDKGDGKNQNSRDSIVEEGVVGEITMPPVVLRSGR